MKSHDLERAFQVSVFFLNAKRASVFKPRMKSVISSTPAHASFCHCAYGLIANWKIVTGSVAIGWRRSALKKWLDNTVNNSGAVSPEMRATDSKHPVTMPLAAALSAIAPIIFHFGAPSANAASRNASGTSLSIFSVVRTIIGICRIASAIAPAQPLKCLNGATNSAYTNRPITIDGALSRISLIKRTLSASRLRRPYSARYTLARIPSGALIAVASPVSIRLPAMALTSPPPSAFGGGVLAVNNDADHPLIPCWIAVINIHASHSRPNAIAAQDRASAMVLRQRRARTRALEHFSAVCTVSLRARRIAHTVFALAPCASSLQNALGPVLIAHCGAPSAPSSFSRKPARPG